jgi:hypothetical protein
MKWLEIIELRSAGNKRAAIESQLQDLINLVNRGARQKKIKVYGHITVETDFSILLYNDSKRADLSGSPLGSRLTSALKEFGLVNYSVWVEKY